MSEMPNSPFLTLLKDYWAPIAAFGTGTFFVIKYIVNLIKEVNKVVKIEVDIEQTKKDVTYIKGKVSAIEKLLKNILPTGQLQLATKYGSSHSPIVLKSDYREFVTAPELDEQIKKKKRRLLNWLKKQKPKTGLDAQDFISNFVISNEVEKYLDLTKYKQNLYEMGKTSIDASGVLAVYLFEVLIPELKLPEKPEEKEKTKE